MGSRGGKIAVTGLDGSAAIPVALFIGEVCGLYFYSHPAVGSHQRLVFHPDGFDDRGLDRRRGERFGHGDLSQDPHLRARGLFAIKQRRWREERGNVE
jgi:hypothetical protein